MREWQDLQARGLLEDMELYDAAVYDDSINGTAISAAPGGGASSSDFAALEKLLGRLYRGEPEKHHAAAAAATAAAAPAVPVGGPSRPKYCIENLAALLEHVRPPRFLFPPLHPSPAPTAATTTTTIITANTKAAATTATSTATSPPFSYLPWIGRDFDSLPTCTMRK
eukprot:jgi/Mesen1/5930/ME000301S05065